MSTEARRVLTALPQGLDSARPAADSRTRARRLLGASTQAILISAILSACQEPPSAAKKNPEKALQAKEPGTETAKVKTEKAVSTPLRHTPFSPEDKSEEEFLEKSLAFQEHWKDQSQKALGHFKGADPRVITLLGFMKENAYYSLPRGPVATLRINKGAEPETNPHGFEIVFMPDIYADQMPSAILTEGSGKTMRIAAEFRSQQWMGIMLAHELSHVYDLQVEGENPLNPQEHLAGEVKAYKFKMKLLRHWNPKVYHELITRGIPLFQRKDKNALLQLIRELYPLGPGEVSGHEAGLGEASCLIAIAFEEAEQKGADEKGLEEALLTVMQEAQGWK